MQSRESARHLLLDAINRRDKVHVEQLLYHGAGMFMDLPKLFLELDVNASHCYVQGLTIEGKRATHATRGFHQAFFSVEEMRLCKLQQDSLTPNATRRMIPLMSLHAAFHRYKNDPSRDGNPEFIAAENEFTKLSVLPSLQKMALQTLLNEDNSFEQVNPDHENVIRLLESRVAELFALQSYINEVAADADRSNELERIEVLLLNIFSVSTGSTAVLFCGYSMVILLFAICCGCPGPLQASLLFLGIPGSIVALLAVVTLILLINRLRQHGCDGLHPVMQYSIRNNPTLADILDKLIAIMSSENLPEDIQEIVDELNNPAIGFERATNHLSTLIQYYTYKEIGNVSKETSQTPLSLFKSESFFWTAAQKNEYNNNRVPERIVMEDETQPLTKIGHLFNTLNIKQRKEADERPGVISMSDDGDIAMLSIRL